LTVWGLEGAVVFFWGGAIRTAVAASYGFWGFLERGLRRDSDLEKKSCSKKSWQKLNAKNLSREQLVSCAWDTGSIWLANSKVSSMVPNIIIQCRAVFFPSSPSRIPLY
jgi:hypothetical protein